MADLTSTYSGIVSALRKFKLYPEFKVSQSAATEAKVLIDGKMFLSFGSNNYLSLSSNPNVKNAAIDAINKYGLGSGSPRIFGGNIDIQNTLETKIAQYLQRESAICFPSGYMANIGVIPALANFFKVPGMEKFVQTLNSRETVFFVDECCHGSILDGVKLSGCNAIRYKHDNVLDIEEIASKNQDKQIIILTQGVFTTEGEIADLRQISNVAKKHHMLLMVDDADGIGVLGANGRGTVEANGLTNQDVPLLMGSFTKAFGGLGGFVAGDRALMDYLRVSSKTYLLSAPLPPAVAAGLICAIDLSVQQRERLHEIVELATTFREKVKKMGFIVLGNHPLIVPILIGDEHNAIEVSQLLSQENISVPVVRFPAVPSGKSRLRFIFTTSHHQRDVEYLIKILEKIKDKVNN